MINMKALKNVLIFNPDKDYYYKDYQQKNTRCEM